MINNKQNAFFSYLALCAAILIPVPGRFAFGLIMIFLFNILILLGTIFNHVIHNLHLESLKSPLLIIFLVLVTLLFKAVLLNVSPILAISLGFVIYLPAASTVLISYFFDEPKTDMTEAVLRNFTEILYFSVCALVIFAFRDIFGYGTLTFPSKGGFFVLNILFTKAKFSAAAFVATIPGALIIVSIFYALFVFLFNKIDTLERAKL